MSEEEFEKYIVVYEYHDTCYKIFKTEQEAKDYVDELFKEYRMDIDFDLVFVGKGI